MIAAILAALPFLAPLLAKVPSLQTLKLIAGATAIVLVVGLAVGGWALYWRESSEFASYKAKAAAHEVALQQKYDAIGGDDAAQYLATVEASQAETQRQLDGMRYAPPIPTPPAVKGKRPSAKRAENMPILCTRDGCDAASIVRLLRDAFAGGKE